MKALVLKATLKRTPATSNPEALARTVMSALSQHGVECQLERVLDYNVLPGVTSDEGEGDKRPGPGESYLETDYKHDRSKSTGELMAANLVAVARLWPLHYSHSCAAAVVTRPQQAPKLPTRPFKEHL